MAESEELLNRLEHLGIDLGFIWDNIEYHEDTDSYHIIIENSDEFDDVCGILDASAIQDSGKGGERGATFTYSLPEEGLYFTLSGNFETDNYELKIEVEDI